MIWTNADPIHWHIYAALGGDEFTHWPLGDVAVILKVESRNISYRLSSWALVKLLIRCTPQNTFADKSTLIQVMAWCREATSHYLSQCWPDLCQHMASLDPHEYYHGGNYQHPVSYHNLIHWPLGWVTQFQNIISKYILITSLIEPDPWVICIELYSESLVKSQYWFS